MNQGELLFCSPRNKTELQKGTINAICRHFIAKKFGWLNKWHFMKLTNLDKKFKALMGGNKGPSTSMKA
jgi:hypothetical protein